MIELDTIVCGDCLDIMPCISNESVDLIVTSPEYYGAPMWKNQISYDEYLLFHGKVIDEAARVLKNGGFLIYNVSQMTVNSFPAKQTIGVYPIHLNIGHMLWAKGLMFREDIIWEKPDGYSNRFGTSITHPYSLCYVPNQVTEHILVFRKNLKRMMTRDLQRDNGLDVDYLKQYRSDIWRMNGVKDKEHPAPYPLELVKALINFYSLKGDLVLDMFAGSGTTCIAAQQLQRHFIGIELNPQYVEVCKRRLNENIR